MVFNHAQRAAVMFTGFNDVHRFTVGYTRYVRIHEIIRGWSEPNRRMSKGSMGRFPLMSTVSRARATMPKESIRGSHVSESVAERWRRVKGRGGEGDLFGPQARFTLFAGR
jgi:hypothetical protein